MVKSTDKAKTDYVRNTVFNNMNNPRKLWKTLKRIAPTISAPSNLSFIEEEDKSICHLTGMARAFNKYFINIQQNTDSVTSAMDANKQIIDSLILKKVALTVQLCSRHPSN